MIYRVLKTREISASHKLNLNYESKCGGQHGHNWTITVECETNKLDENSMVVDFAGISSVLDALDHQDLNKFIGQPTAERIGEWILGQIPGANRVRVQESQGNVCIVERESGVEDRLIRKLADYMLSHNLPVNVVIDEEKLAAMIAGALHDKHVIMLKAGELMPLGAPRTLQDEAGATKKPEGMS